MLHEKIQERDGQIEELRVIIKGGAGPIPQQSPQGSPSSKKNFIAANKRAYSKVSLSGGNSQQYNSN